MRHIATSLFVLLVTSIFFALPSAGQTTCTSTVTAPDSIQAAIDADPGGVVCLQGTFEEPIAFGPQHNGTTLRSAVEGAPAYLANNAGCAICLLDGVNGVTIEGLDISSSTGPAIFTADGSTSNITVRKNNIHDTAWAVFVLSGSNIHTGWVVDDNTVSTIEGAAIWLNNCSGCSVHNNITDGGGSLASIGIFISAMFSNGTQRINGVSVTNNVITGSYWSLLVVAGFGRVLQAVSLTGNNITTIGAGVTLNGMEKYAILNPSVVRNTIACSEGSFVGVWLDAHAPDGPIGVLNAKVVNNKNSCAENWYSGGDSTKLPPVPPHH